MRWIIALLLMLNGGFFAWQYYQGHVGTQDSSVSKNGDMEHDTLVLLSELSDERKEQLGITAVNGGTKVDEVKKAEPEQDSKVAKEKEKEKVKEIEKVDGGMQGHANNKKKQEQQLKEYCYSVGPMINVKQVERVKKRLGSMGLTIKEVRKDVEKVPSHWIYLDGIKSESDAKNVIARLKSKGIKDTQLIKRSSTNMVVSVGLFATKAGADDRLRKLQNAGFAPKISMVTAKKNKYWIELHYNDGQKVNKETLQGLLKGVEGASVTSKECKH